MKIRISLLGLFGSLLLMGCATTPVLMLGPEGDTKQCRFDRSKTFFQAREDQNRCVENLRSKGFREVDPETAFRAMLERSVGKLKYDDFLEKWGPPTSASQGDRVTVAIWRKEKDEVVTMYSGSPFGDPLFYDPDPFYNPYDPLGMDRPLPFGNPYYSPSISETISHGREIRLTFDKTTGLLKRWHYKIW